MAPSSEDFSRSRRAGEASIPKSPSPSSRFDINGYRKSEAGHTADQSPSTNTPPAMKLSDYSSTRSADEPPLPPRKSQLTSFTSLNLAYKAIRCAHLKPRVTVEQLRDHFLICQGLEHVYLPLKQNGKAKDYGMVSFEDSMSAQAAQKALNGTKLCGKPLNLVLTRPMSSKEIRFSKSADPRALSEKDIHRITSAKQRLADVEYMRNISEKDLPIKRQLSQKKRVERNQTRVQNLAKLLGVEDTISVAIDFDKIVQDIDNNYHHESEIGRNSRIWNLQFEYFDVAATEVVKERVAFKDRNMFKPSPDDEATTKRDRYMLLGWIAALYENTRKFRSLEKVFNKDVKFPPREELSFELKLREIRGSLTHALRSGPNFIIDWEDGHEVCFTYTDKLLKYMEFYKGAVRRSYSDAIKSEKLDESFNYVFVPREWAVEPMETRYTTYFPPEPRQTRVQEGKPHSEEKVDGDLVNNGRELDEDTEDRHLYNTYLEGGGLENGLLGGISSGDDCLENGEMEEGELEDY